MISPRTLHADPGALVATPRHQTLLRFDNPEMGSDAAIGLGRLATQEKLGAQHRLPDPDRRSGGGCVGPLRVLGVIVALIVLFGWAATLFTKFNQG